MAALAGASDQCRRARSTLLRWLLLLGGANKRPDLTSHGEMIAAPSKPAELSARSLAAFNAQVQASDEAALAAPADNGLPFEPLDDVALLLAAEQSAARQEHLAALQREFDELAALTADDASGWRQHRKQRAACALQSAWRRRAARTAFFRAVHVTV